MSIIKLTGVLIMKGDVQQVTEKFAKREFAIETTGAQYPQKQLIQLTQDGVNLLDNFNVGDLIDVNVNLRGRDWTDPKTDIVKYFNSLEAWTIQLSKPNQQTPEKITPDNLQTKTDAPQLDLEDDDLPF